MGFRVLLSRLFRKKLLDTRPSHPTSGSGNVLLSAISQTSNSNLVVGYLVAFSYSAILAPSTLPAAVFVASIVALLSDFCKYEVLTSRRKNSSTCLYNCTYQILGELPAYLQGWLQVLKRTIIVTLLARGLGSVMIHSVGLSSIGHLIAPSQDMVNEDFVGIVAQIVATSFILCGLQMTAFFSMVVKILLSTAVPLLIAVLAYYLKNSDETSHHPVTFIREDFLSSVALLVIPFISESKEPQLLSKSSTMSVYLGANYCIHLLFLVVSAIMFSFLPLSVLIHQKSSSPLLEILTSVTHDRPGSRHWFVVTFSCCCIVIGSLSLVEALQDGKRLLVKMAYDGLLFKRLAANTKWAQIALCILSVCLEATLTTFNLIVLVAFVQLALDATIGLVVVYRRYCTGSPYSISPKTTNNRQSLNNRESDSEDTDIDEAVEEYKTQVFVSTIMEWNGLETATGSRNPYRCRNHEATSTKTKKILFFVTLLVVIMSLAIRYIASYHQITIPIVVVSLIFLLLLLAFIWLHPQRIRARNAIFRTPCVPWIPVLSVLFHCVLLFQLPILTLGLTAVWFLLGLIFYGVYGYRCSRLNFHTMKKVAVPSNDTPSRRLSNGNIATLRMPQALIDIHTSSVAVYPQPYQSLM